MSSSHICGPLYLKDNQIKVSSAFKQLFVCCRFCSGRGGGGSLLLNKVQSAFSRFCSYKPPSQLLMIQTDPAKEEVLASQQLPAAAAGRSCRRAAEGGVCTNLHQLKAPARHSCGPLSGRSGQTRAGGSALNEREPKFDKRVTNQPEEGKSLVVYPKHFHSCSHSRHSFGPASNGRSILIWLGLCLHIRPKWEIVQSQTLLT